jgi:hypothetical protein
VTLTDYVLIVSCSHSTNTVRFWLNNATATEVSYSFPSTSADSSTLAIGAQSRGGNELISGSRIYGVSLGNTFIADAEAALIFAEYEKRHNRSYLS